MTSARSILVPLDGTPTANRGLREAIRLARARKAGLLLLHVVDEGPAYMQFDCGLPPEDLARGLIREGRRTLQRAQRLAARSHIRARVVLRETVGEPAADEIVRQAKRLRADLIVMGSHARRRPGASASNAERVRRASPVPVLVVRGRR